MSKSNGSPVVGPVKLTVILWLLGLVAILCLLYWSPCGLPSFSKFYEEKLRDPLFSGLLSLTGFLFALKTFILTNMKTSLYDRPAYERLYRECIDEYRETHADPDLPKRMKRYAGLDELRHLLAFTLVICLIASIFQLSVGLIGHWLASAVSVLAAINAVSLLWLSVWNMHTNMRHLVSYWNSEYEMSPEERHSYDPNAND